MKIKVVNKQCWIGEPADAPYGMALMAYDVDKLKYVHYVVHTTQIEDPEWHVLPEKGRLNDFINHINTLFPGAEIICDVDAVN